MPCLTSVDPNEPFAFLLLKERVARAADRTDSRVPDSLGDRLVRLSLRMYSAIMSNTKSAALMQEAHGLLGELAGTGDTRW